MYPPAVFTAEPTDDENSLFTKTIYVFAPPAADDIQGTITTGAGNLLHALYKKHLFYGFQLARILLQ